MRAHKIPFPRFGRVTIVVGPPIVPEARTSGVVARDKVDDVTATLADALQVVLDDANGCATARRCSSRFAGRCWCGG